MSLRARTALVALLVFLVTAGPALGAVHATGAGVAAQETPPTAGSDETTFVIALQPDGDASWTVRMNFSTPTSDRRDAFNETAAEFEQGVDLRTLTAVRAASQQASAATGREMEITNVEYDSATYNNTGQLIVRFTWTNFSRLDGDWLYVDDVFNTTGVTWFQSLGPDQSLVVVPPEEYTLVDAPPSGYEVSEGSLRWVGEQTFGPGDLAVTYRDVGDAPGGFAWLQNLELAAAVLVGGVLVVGLYLVRRRDGDVPASAAENEGQSDDGTDREPDAAAAPEPTDDASAEEAVDTELLSDEERVERLLERNGGRMKQANIVTETGWSNAKVSQLLSSMDEDGRIDKLRIGRENLISFPDEDITETNGEDPEDSR
ncbi:helix-turn-helix transcriptional regulator [Halorientalis litorea]|uniref:helix-turn-helix transcriptional regulator n=1 Tax=Halorientalis litorea TaxID=2931977 RepID=UPI001FF15B76|nr:hypothetical protein [Halorientalis litorea]